MTSKIKTSKLELFDEDEEGAEEIDLGSSKFDDVKFDPSKLPVF